MKAVHPAHEWKYLEFEDYFKKKQQSLDVIYTNSACTSQQTFCPCVFFLCRHTWERLLW